MNKNMSNK